MSSFLVFCLFSLLKLKIGLNRTCFLFLTAYLHPVGLLLLASSASQHPYNFLITFPLHCLQTSAHAELSLSMLVPIDFCHLLFAFVWALLCAFSHSPICLPIRNLSLLGPICFLRCFQHWFFHRLICDGVDRICFGRTYYPSWAISLIVSAREIVHIHVLANICRNAQSDVITKCLCSSSNGINIGNEVTAKCWGYRTE